MPRRPKGARLWLRPESRDGATGVIVEPATWIIRDGGVFRRTGCAAHEVRQAEQALAEYIQGRHEPSRAGNRDPDQIEVADVLSIYVTDIVERHARPAETKGRIRALAGFWGTRKLSEVNGRTCREYARRRGAPAAARRELEDLRAAINHHRREGLCSNLIEVTLPPKGQGRERWLTRDEAARLLWAAYRYREVQKGIETERRSRRHIARFILVALYTGTRAAAICGAAFAPGHGRGWIDLDRGVFYRRGEGVRETKKKTPPIRLPDRLLAHLRRWHRMGIANTHAVEFGGEPVTRITKAFNNAAREAGLNAAYHAEDHLPVDKRKARRDVTPHVLRHTAVTWAMQNSADPGEADGFFGMTAETRQRVYMHHHPDFQKGVAQAVTRSPAAQKPHRLKAHEREQNAEIESVVIELHKGAGK